MGGDNVHPIVRSTGVQLLDHFVSDNTSPETHSFYIVRGAPGRGPGKELARETAKRFLLTQLLVMYANEKLELASSGQKAMIYFSPHPPVRQKRLSACISDSFYRELFMSPCLSGWDRGEAKQEYMSLCHEVLSRSRLNAVAKLHDAGINTSNLVVLPSTSDISLANNGTHVSLGSDALTRMRNDPSSGFGLREEKQAGDFAVKIMEHFLPLFVKTYSAAPYRFDFADFHPERVLGFLPHELDYTHLRMLWRRWKAKADIRFCGRPVTPLGPPLLDRAISRIAGLSGDFVPDFRLIDYLVGLLSTERSAALNGDAGQQRTPQEGPRRPGRIRHAHVPLPAAQAQGIRQGRLLRLRGALLQPLPEHQKRYGRGRGPSEPFDRLCLQIDYDWDHGERRIFPTAPSWRASAGRSSSAPPSASLHFL